MEALGNGNWVLRKESYEIITALNQETGATPKFLLCILNRDSELEVARVVSTIEGDVPL